MKNTAFLFPLLTAVLRFSNWASSENVNGIYIPSALIIVGTAIVKKEWLPYAAALAAVLSAWKVFSNSKGFLKPYDDHLSSLHLMLPIVIEGVQLQLTG